MAVFVHDKGHIPYEKNEDFMRNAKPSEDYDDNSEGDGDEVDEDSD